MFNNEEDFSLAAEFGGIAAYYLLRKSRAERTYQNYLISAAILPYAKALDKLIAERIFSC